MRYNRNFGKMKELKTANALLIATCAVLIVSIALLDGSRWNIWLHVIAATLLTANVIWHIHLHRTSRTDRPSLWKSIRTKLSKALAVIFLLTVFTGIPALAAYLSGGYETITMSHNIIGHIAMLLLILHPLKKRKWYRRTSSPKRFIPEVDQGKCIRCNQCVKRCPAAVFVNNDGTVTADNSHLCIQCGKCAKKCPEQAISCSL